MDLIGWRMFNFPSPRWGVMFAPGTEVMRSCQFLLAVNALLPVEVNKDGIRYRRRTQLPERQFPRSPCGECLPALQKIIFIENNSG
jgi:hypothetical protein